MLRPLCPCHQKSATKQPAQAKGVNCPVGLSVGRQGVLWSRRPSTVGLVSAKTGHLGCWAAAGQAVCRAAVQHGRPRESPELRKVCCLPLPGQSSVACFPDRAATNREGNRVPDAAAAPVARREQACGCCSDRVLCLLLALFHTYWREPQSPESLYFVWTHVTFSSQGEAGTCSFSGE